MDDELLREASDPTTPGERLWELWESYGYDSLRGNDADGFPDPRARATTETLACAEALARNPSLPLDLLHDELLSRAEVAL